MPDNTALSTRMKENYENRSKQYLTRRTPTIIRLDGKAFHTYTKGLSKPFDEGLIEDMQETTKFLCQNIEGCKMGYTQSDEITLVLTDYDTFETLAWFDYNVQKMTSISASMATAKFNQLRLQRSFNIINRTIDKLNETGLGGKLRTDNLDVQQTLAYFDSRVFQIPEKEEVVNCLIWRQRDAEKNSISMLAQSLYSHKELHKKNSSDMQEMCFQKGHNWNDLHFSKKRGSFIVKNTYFNGINKDAKNSKGNRVFEYFPDTNKYAKFDTVLAEWVDLVNPTIRTKWEVIETPFFGKDRNSILDLI
jgi:tRNA(His) 5'-end guanylyltransferase|nr:MAG TPA: tRNAHis guanylyltransferase [Caudoviricetes sp.]